jgi:hypothetical protein
VDGALEAPGDFGRLREQERDAWARQFVERPAEPSQPREFAFRSTDFMTHGFSSIEWDSEIRTAYDNELNDARRPDGSEYLRGFMHL